VTDPDLIVRARAGNETAWETLVRAHQQAVFRLAYLLLGNAHDAEDVTQEVFIRAFHSLDRFDQDRPLRPWLLQITANLARNHHRTLGRYLAAVRRLIQDRPDEQFGIIGQSVAHLEAGVLWNAVRRLSVADQQIIYLRYFLDLSEAETREALGIAPGTVKSRLHRAVQRLRTVVDREYPGLREGRQA
jgi:RNA polymerase sigma-70 factor (ECF subfamily)